MLSRSPKYQEIYKSIERKIVDGNYQPGDLISSEAELERMFKVSRTPVREALKCLKLMGYIFRVQGKGSYVTNRKSKEKELWTTMTGFRNHYEKEWNKLSAKTITKHMTRHPEYSEVLKEDKELNYLSRIRNFDGEPAVFLEYYIRPIISLDIFDQYATSLSVEQILNEVKGISIEEVDEEIDAIIADPYIAGILHIPKKTPLLKIKRISYTKGLIPVLLCIYYVRSDMMKYFINYKNS